MESKIDDSPDAATMNQIKEAWKLFDKDDTGFMVQEEIGTVMRYLGVFPGERTLVLEIIPSMQDDDQSGGNVSYEKFAPKMLELINSREMDADSAETLLQAFRTIDTDNQGYISSDVLETLLTSKGTAFRPKEMEDFMMLAKDPETGNVYYEDYIYAATRARNK
tara:strand:+ start:5758 stop:6249 length:492 start_codon:yes stop_codon:yes gene_type:complete